MVNKSFTAQVRIAVAPAEVFRALADRTALETWFAEHADVSLDEGRFEFWGRYTPHGQDRGRQRLLAVEPDRLLCFGWTLDSAERTTEIRIEPETETDTLVTLDQFDAPDWGFYRASLADFWALSVTNLILYAEGLDLLPRHDFTRPPAIEARAEITIDAPAEQVFAALIEPARINRWTGGNAVVEPHVGGRYDFGWDHGPVKILELEPNRTLSYSWQKEGDPDTVVRWELAESNGKTHLTIVHSGFDAERPADGFQIGWQGFLFAIKGLHELGDPWSKMSWQ